MHLFLKQEKEEQHQLAVTAYLKNSRKEHQRILARRQTIEERKERLESLNIQREKEELEQREAELQKVRKAEEERLRQEAKEREKERILQEHEQIKKKTMGMAIASASAAVINVGLNLLLLPKFGYVASGYSISISYVILLLIHIGLVRRLGCGDMYDLKMIFATVIGMVLIMLGINALYGAPVLRYVIMVVYAAVFLLVAWKYRNLIFAVLRREKKKA